MGRPPKYKIGQVKDKLTVLNVISNGGKLAATYELLCECGKVTRMSTGCLNGSRSCGCAQYTERRVNKNPKIHWKLPKGESSINTLFRRYERGAEKRNLSFEIDRELFVKLIFDKCYYCGIEPCSYFEKPRSNGGITSNGIDRYDNNKGYTVENSVTACKSCNLSKNNRRVADFLSHAKRVTEFQKSRKISCLFSPIKSDNEDDVE